MESRNGRAPASSRVPAWAASAFPPLPPHARHVTDLKLWFCSKDIKSAFTFLPEGRWQQLISRTSSFSSTSGLQASALVQSGARWQEPEARRPPEKATASAAAAEWRLQSGGRKGQTWALSPVLRPPLSSVATPAGNTPTGSPCGCFPGLWAGWEQWSPLPEALFQREGGTLLTWSGAQATPMASKAHLSYRLLWGWDPQKPPILLPLNLGAGMTHCGFKEKPPNPIRRTDS